MAPLKDQLKQFMCITTITADTFNHITSLFTDAHSHVT